MNFISSISHNLSIIEGGVKITTSITAKHGESLTSIFSDGIPISTEYGIYPTLPLIKEAVEKDGHKFSCSVTGNYFSIRYWQIRLALWIVFYMYRRYPNYREIYKLTNYDV